MKKLPYKEGTWFIVPLKCEGFAVGIAARVAPRGKILLAYFFGPQRDKIPKLEELSSLTADQAILTLMVGDLGLINGQWQIIGQHENWKREDWPMIDFVRREEREIPVYYLVKYSDDDPSKRPLETQITLEESIGLQTDSLSGFGAAEIKLSKLLC